MSLGTLGVGWFHGWTSTFTGDHVSGQSGNSSRNQRFEDRGATVARAATAEERRTQLSEQRRRVDFDTYDVTVEELLRRVERGRIDIAPVYQRQFRWDAARQSRLIESVLLGIPVPPLFMATNQGEDVQSQWEVVDGLQRLLTLTNFAGDANTRQVSRLDDKPLRLMELEKLTSFAGSYFHDLPEDIRTGFEDRPVRVVVLNDKSDLQVRYDLFERLNTGGVSLTAQEIRECVYRGEFIDLLGSLSASDEFKTVVVLPITRWKDGTPEDFVLRFFAFRERYRSFGHSVTDFLNEFAYAAYQDPQLAERREAFDVTFRYLVRCFPHGVKTRKGQTPVNLFEALAVGASLALAESPTIPPVIEPAWVTSDELRVLTTGATNSRSRVTGRIEFCRDHFLRHDA
jgi:hypothetical protein